jgi:hypothetical protein
MKTPERLLLSLFIVAVRVIFIYLERKNNMSLVEAIKALKEIVEMTETMDQNDKMIYEFQINRITELCNQILINSR